MGICFYLKHKIRMKKQQAPFWKLPNAQDDYDCSMTNHLSQQLTVQSAQSTQLQKTEKTSCIIHDIAVLAVLLWLNLHLYLHYGFLFLSIVGNYHNNFKYIWADLIVIVYKDQDRQFCFVFLV